MKIKRNIVFYPKNADGRIIVQIRYEAQRLEFSIGENADGLKWSKETQRVKASGFNKKGASGYSVNSTIENYIKAIDSAFVFYENEETTPTAKQLREKIREKLGKPSENKQQIANIPDLIDCYISERSILNSWSKGTERKWHTIKNHFAAWNGCNNVNDFNAEMFGSYCSYLIACGYNNSTSKREIKFVKTFLRWCKNKKLYSGDALDVFELRLKTAENEIIYLTWPELMRVYNLDLKNRPFIEMARDLFCFQCFTGLRFSDAYALRADQIRDGVIHITTNKTGAALEIELNKYSAEIVEKYKDKQNKKGRLFSCSSNQKTNDALKIVGQLANLDEKITKIHYNGGERHEETKTKAELLTTHAGRRTFVVNALYLGVPEIVVRSWTGHADARSMKPYTKIVDELKANEMKKFNI